MTVIAWGKGQADILVSFWCSILVDSKMDSNLRCFIGRGC